MSVYIPLEIQEDILKRLPLKPLIQFRSVSKPWKRLIDSPKFIVSYGVHHPHPDRFILRYKDSYDDKYLTLVDNDDDHSLVQQDFVPTIPYLVKKYESNSIRVVGSSHGLMCFVTLNVTGTVILWNPSINKSVGIEIPYYSEDFGNVEDNVIAFGVCPVTFDPIVLNIMYMRYKQTMNFMPWKVRIFTLSTGTWSILPTSNLPREPIKLIGEQVVIDRFIYRRAFYMRDAGDGQSQSRYLIVSFDLIAKEFKEINSNGFCGTLSKLRESLVGLEYHSDWESFGSFGLEYHSDWESFGSLWMMKEDGVNRSFTKLYNFEMPSFPRFGILGFRKTRELIMETARSCSSPDAEVQIYDPDSEAIHNLRIFGASDSFFMCSYMETLLLVDKLDGFIYSIRN